MLAIVLDAAWISADDGRRALLFFFLLLQLLTMMGLPRVQLQNGRAPRRMMVCDEHWQCLVSAKTPSVLSLFPTVDPYFRALLSAGGWAGKDAGDGRRC